MRSKYCCQKIIHQNLYTENVGAPNKTILSLQNIVSVDVYVWGALRMAMEQNQNWNVEQRKEIEDTNTQQPEWPNNRRMHEANGIWQVHKTNENIIVASKQPGLLLLLVEILGHFWVNVWDGPNAFSFLVWQMPTFDLAIKFGSARKKQRMRVRE